MARDYQKRSAGFNANRPSRFRRAVVAVAAECSELGGRGHREESGDHDETTVDPRLRGPGPAGDILVAFADDLGAWYAVNDGVMGGLSDCSMHRTGRGTGMFAGVLSLDNNGGFASVRTLLGGRDVSGAAGLELRVRGDGRAYQLRLRTDDRFDGIAYATGFGTVDQEWIWVRLPLADFQPTFRGRRVRGAPALDATDLQQLIFMIADKRAGPFALEIEVVRTYGAEL